MTTYYLYTLQAYQREDKQGNIFDSAAISVIAQTQEEAVEKARTVLKKNKYRVSGVMEYVYDHRQDKVE